MVSREIWIKQALVCSSKTSNKDGNVNQYNKSLKRIEYLQYMNNLDIVLALFTTPNHRFSRLDTTAAFQAATSAT